MSNELKLPPLPEPTIEGSVMHPELKICYRAPVHYTADQVQEAMRAAVIADRAARPVADAGEVVAWAIYRTRPDENDGKEFFYHATFHNETTLSEGERYVKGRFVPDSTAPSARALPTREKLDELWVETGNLAVGDAERLLAFAVAAIMEASSTPAEAPSVREVENEIVRLADELAHGYPDALKCLHVDDMPVGRQLLDAVASHRALQGKPEAAKGGEPC